MTCIGVNEENNYVTQLMAIGQSYENIGAIPERQKALITQTEKNYTACKHIQLHYACYKTWPCCSIALSM